MSRKKILTTTIGVVISVIALYFAFRNISFPELMDSFRTVNWLWTVPFCLITWVAFWWRAVRWRRLLEPWAEEAGRTVKTGEVWGPMMVGFAFNNVLPLRAGEIARPLALYKQSRVPVTTAISTVVLERVFDVLALLAFFIFMSMTIELKEGIALSWQGIEISADLLRSLVNKAAIAAAILFAGSIAMLSQTLRNLGLKIILALPLLPQAWKEKIASMFEAFASGFDALRKPSRIALVTFDSVVIWLLMAWSYQVMAWGFPGIELSFLHGVTFLVITCVLISIPSVPGYWGLYEIGGIWALMLVGVIAQTSAGQSTGMGYTLLVHFLQWALTGAIGFYYAAKIHISVGEVSDTAATTEAAP